MCAAYYACMSGPLGVHILESSFAFEVFADEVGQNAHYIWLSKDVVTSLYERKRLFCSRTSTVLHWTDDRGAVVGWMEMVLEWAELFLWKSGYGARTRMSIKNTSSHVLFTAWNQRRDCVNLFCSIGTLVRTYWPLFRAKAASWWKQWNLVKIEWKLHFPKHAQTHFCSWHSYSLSWAISCKSQQQKLSSFSSLHQNTFWS